MVILPKTRLHRKGAVCDHGKWPSWLVRLADARPEAKTLFAFAWDWDKDLSPDPRVEFVYGKDDENGGDFALALWLRMDATQEVHSAFAGSKGLERPEEPGVALAAGKDVRFNAGLAGGGAFDLKPYDIVTGAWTFYAVTRSSDGVVRFYQGGQDGNLYWMSENADLSLAAAAPFCVGAAGDDDASRFAGDIDDFALWTRTLSHDDVRRIYEAGLKGAPLADLL